MQLSVIQLCYLFLNRDISISIEIDVSIIKQGNFISNSDIFINIPNCLPQTLRTLMSYLFVIHSFKVALYKK